MGETKIEWAEKSWNPVTGCSKVSDGCLHCYAEKMAKRLQATGVAKYKDGFAVRCHPEYLAEPLHWRKPSRVFVCSMADLFHEDVPVWFIDRVFEVMEACPQHTFQVLTKRAKRLEGGIYGFDVECPVRCLGGGDYLPNVHMGVTVENQQAADERIPLLLDTPASVRWVSCEPLLDFVDFTAEQWRKLDWLVVGCETGPNRRECWLEWVNYLVNRATAYAVPVFVKKLVINGKVSNDPAEWPEWARRREYPKAKA